MSAAVKKVRKPSDDTSVATMTTVQIPQTLAADGSTTGALGIEMPAYTATGPNVPPARPYVFEKRVTDDVAVAVRLGLNVMFTGPTGCGKSSLPFALAHVTRRPIVRFNCDGETRVAHLRGQQRPAAKDGVLTLVFSLGALAQAMLEGWWVVLDELDAAHASVLFTLQRVLEEDNRSLQIPETGKVIVAHPEFRIFATGNTIGYRAVHRGRHAGTNPMNSAFLDRFGAVLAVDYPDVAGEFERIMANVPHIDRAYADGISRAAAELRKDQRFKADFSTRRCVQWARLAHEFDGDMLRAAELAVIRKFENTTDASVATEIIKRIFGYT